MEKSTLQFLSKLEKNNNRDWFNENKSLYLEAQADVINFVENLIQEIGKFDEDILKLDAKKSLFRIYRDTRFSKDKSPYKNNFGASLGIGKGSQKAGYYIHIQPGKSFVGCGVYQPESNTLKKIRTEISRNGAEFLQIINDKNFKNTFGELSREDQLKKIPQGFEKEDLMADYLKLKSFVVLKNITDTEILDKNAVENLGSYLKSAKEFNAFLNRAVEQ